MINLIPTVYAADSAAFGAAIDPILQHIVSPIVGLLFAIAIVVFAFGVFQLIRGDSDSETRTQGKKAMISGVIGMFIMLSAWGFIYLISNTVSALSR